MSALAGLASENSNQIAAMNRDAKILTDLGKYFIGSSPFGLREIPVEDNSFFSGNAQDCDFC